MQTLFSLSRQSMSNTQRVQEVEQEIDRYAQETDVLDIESVNVFNADGVQTATNSPYTVMK